jgi:hypothetical protein
MKCISIKKSIPATSPMIANGIMGIFKGKEVMNYSKREESDNLHHP